MAAASAVCHTASRAARLPCLTADTVAAISAAWPQRWMVVMAFAVAAAAPAVAVAVERPTTTIDDPVAFLTRVQQAAQRQNYAGTYVHQQGTQVESSRVVHRIDRNGEHEKLELLDGQEREFIRNNDDVRCYVPDRKLVVVEKRARYDTFPALLTTDGADIDRYYRMSADGFERVAGRNAQIVTLEARDHQRYGYRLWFDRDTSLLLKAQTISEKGVVIEQLAFSEVTIGGTIDAARLRPTALHTESWRVESSRLVPVDLEKAGWSVGQPVAGFHKVMEVRRAFGGREDVGQLVYSDGLAAISIFIEPSAPRDATEGDAVKGPVNIVMKRHGDFWLTVVGDAPAASVRKMAEAIDFKPRK